MLRYSSAKLRMSFTVISEDSVCSVNLQIRMLYTGTGEEIMFK